jgi:hypothetical protein
MCLTYLQMICVDTFILVYSGNNQSLLRDNTTQFENAILFKYMQSKLVAILKISKLLYLQACLLQPSIDGEDLLALKMK